MGIRFLNKLIRQFSRNGTKQVPLFNLKGKVIVIDISIYLYRFASSNTLIEGIYSLCSTLQFYNIKPICIFDGLAPKEKMTEIMNRKRKKNDAKAKYNILQKNMDDVDDYAKRSEIKKQMLSLRRKFITVSHDERYQVKQLLEKMGISYYQATGEADKLCAKLVLNGTAYACLSDDTDLFVYGCPRVLRYISLRHHTVVRYDLDKVFNDLNIDLSNFRKMCVLSGTDYNQVPHRNNIFYNYKKFKRAGELAMTNEDQVIYNLFDLDDLDISKDKFYNYSSIDKKELHNFLEKYGFVYP